MSIYVLSVLVPARNEVFLQKTITDLLTKAIGDIEVIAILDGYWPTPQLIADDRLKIIHHGKSRGMRAEATVFQVVNNQRHLRQLTTGKVKAGTSKHFHFPG